MYLIYSLLLCTWLFELVQFLPNLMLTVSLRVVFFSGFVFSWSLREILGDLIFLHVAGCAPASCQLGLTEGEEDRMDAFFDSAYTNAIGLHRMPINHP